MTITRLASLGGRERFAPRGHKYPVCPFEAAVEKWQSNTVVPAEVEPPTRTKTVPAFAGP